LLLKKEDLDTLTLSSPFLDKLKVSIEMPSNKELEATKGSSLTPSISFFLNSDKFERGWLLVTKKELFEYIVGNVENEKLAVFKNENSCFFCKRSREFKCNCFSLIR
jgi:hypothetical protein